MSTSHLTHIDKPIKHVLADTTWKRHLGKEYEYEDTLYYYTLGKVKRDRFDNLVKGDQCVTLRLNADGTITALTFEYERTTPALTGITGEVRGQIKSVEHFANRQVCREQYPEAFERVREKFKTGVCITNL
ncbi:hypothetical protein [Vibrio alfacsensis]|uniref:hypothetical protein n=1 Tax=Vibrio alfacsensis TaxID=1074311 RepID=UPI0040698A53